ncbi:hypothetical protein M2418_000412 [Rhizobium sp. BIGb0125]|uniref:hypothetical protein n=1 Tax=Rhizobium sp. BIGb0125 TaxID=2940618 RepID=UPI002166C22F|nr:hypothetical protein [Rhizobium sp. BIGb0125]MCS4240910.1 hypothetical protein [Rhizobium sp. BIGb0125]
MLTLEGLSEPASAAVLEAIQMELAEVGKAVQQYHHDESNRPPEILANRVRTKEQLNAELTACGPALRVMFSEAVELRMFTTQRKLLLAQYGFDDDPRPSRVTLKAQPERLGALLIVTFLDRLACVDPKRWYDAIFLPEGEMMEIWWSINAPKAGLRRWLARRKAEGRPWQERESLPELPANSVTWDDFKKVRAILYPKGVSGDHSPRRHLTPAEAHEALRAAHAEINGEPPHAISMLMKLDIDNLTPVKALSTLKHLQDVARRRDIGPRLFDGPEGG